MTYDTNKVGETVLAILMLTLHDAGPDGGRAWKGIDWDVLDRLHREGLISNPRSHNKSVELTAEAVRRGRAVFERLFGGLPAGGGTAICDLSAPDAARPVVDAVHDVPHLPGVYAILIDDAANLPGDWRQVLELFEHRVLYIGSAQDSLRQRLVEEDLRHRRASTFFRSLGAVLGYRPPHGSLRGMSNQQNYRFSEEHTAAITQWIEQHVRLNWMELPAENVRAFEREMIRSTTPLLNIKHRVAPNPKLQELREECRRIACEE